MIPIPKRNERGTKTTTNRGIVKIAKRNESQHLEIRTQNGVSARRRKINETIRTPTRNVYEFAQILNPFSRKVCRFWQRRNNPLSKRNKIFFNCLSDCHRWHGNAGLG